MPELSRRQFAWGLGAGRGGAIALPRSAAAWWRQPHDVPPDVVQLNSNENPYGPSPAALAAAADLQAAASRYPDAVEDKLRDAIAALHRVEPDQVVLGCGSGEVLRMADAAFLGPGKRVVVCEPTFEAVLGYAQVLQAEPVRVPQTPDFRHDLPRMAAACDERTGVVYVCNPNNPTGTIVTRDELGALLDRAPASATVLVDEAYHHFVEDPRYCSAFEWISSRENLVVVRTFSKIYGMAGLRLGYGVGSRERIQAMRGHATWNNTNAAALGAALASLGDERHVQRQRELNSSTRAALVRRLEAERRRVIPSHTNFLMFEVGSDVGPLVQSFRAKKILVGRRFPSMAQWLRVSIGTPPEMDSFAEALRAILPAVPAPA
jgi:histidinol-phosphate aminotransferase